MNQFINGNLCLFGEESLTREYKRKGVCSNCSWLSSSGLKSNKLISFQQGWLDDLAGHLATLVSFKTRQTRCLIKTTKRGRNSHSRSLVQRCLIRAASTQACFWLRYVMISVSKSLFLLICYGHDYLKHNFKASVSQQITDKWILSILK